MNVLCVLCSLLLVLPQTLTLPPPCSSDIYCHGLLLHIVQMSRIFGDSKTFVDMKMKQSRSETLASFEEFIQKYNQTEKSFEDFMGKLDQPPYSTDIKKFVNATFDPPDSEFEKFQPTDFVPHPKFLKKITDPSYKKWADELNHFWEELGRKMKEEVKENEELYSIIYVPNPVIVPGGRFREFYYWDSYWIIRGLLLSEMTTTVKGMLENFLHMVRKYGLVPNGGRVYYTRRSQPPLLIPMVESYFSTTRDLQFLKDNINDLENEFLFWMNNHTVTVEKDGKKYKLAHYYAPSSGPRPESYREDYMSVQHLKTDKEKEEHYVQLKTAAESGWDFSTRWYIYNGTNQGNLSHTKTQYIIPVDLNAILYWNARLLSEFYDLLEDPFKALQYTRIADSWLEAVTQVLWHEQLGVWLDYDMINNVKRNYFYPSNLAPLWTGCFKQKIFPVRKLMKYLEQVNIMRYLGGVPTSLDHSQEQWDFPNTWPPLQYIVIMALENTGDPWAQQLGFELTERWVRANYKAYNESNQMYEKYSAVIPGVHGGGGEYVNQIGFGWTNGVILELLDMYGSKLSVRDKFFVIDIESSSLGLSSTILTIITSALFLLWL